MTDLTKRKAPLVWSERCQKAFEDTKHALTSSPVMGLPDHCKHFEVVCDASLINIGVVLITWAAWYNTWLLIKLTPKGVVFSFLLFSRPDLEGQASSL